MDDVIDLDATVEASWRTFQQEYAAALGELRPGQFLRASVDDGGDGVGVSYCVLAYSWGGEVGVVVEGNDVLACGYRLTRADMAGLRKRGLRRLDRGSEGYRLVLPMSEARRAAGVAASVLRDVFSVIHPAFLKGGGFSVCGRARSE